MFDIDKVYNNWSVERITRHIVYWMLWLIFFAVVNSNYHEGHFGLWIQIEITVMLIKLPFTYFVIYFLVPRYLIQKAYFQFALWVGISSIIGGIITNALYYYIMAPIFFNETYPTFWTLKIGFKVVDLIYVASLPTILKLIQRQIQQEKHTRQITEEKLNAELQLLKSQLQPHFLFNTLNNLYGMVLTKDEASPQVVIRLSEIMSYMLYESDHTHISLEKEIKHLNNYIALEKIRHHDRLDLTFEISGPLEGKRIAPLLMLPFVENAFKHGVEQSETSAWICINIWINENTMEFMVENSIPEIKENDTDATKMLGGIGLENVKKRLTLLYPNQHRLIIRNGTTHFAKLILELSNSDYHEMSDRG